MASTTLTAEMRDIIVHRATEKAFDCKAFSAKVRAAERALAEKVYRKVVSEEVEAIVRKHCPKMVVYREIVHYRVASNDESFSRFQSIRMSESRPMPPDGTYEVVTEEEAKEYEDLLEERKKLDEQSTKFRQGLYTLLKKFRTVEKLKAAWPEMSALIDPGWTEKPESFPVALPIEEMNALIFKKDKSAQPA